MKYNKVMGFGAIVAFMLCMMMLIAPGASAATAGSIDIDGLNSATNEVKANAADITLNATGTKITEVVFMGGDDLNSMKVLASYDEANVTAFEEVFVWNFTTQGDKVCKLCILDNGVWDNTTIAAFSVSTYMIPFINNYDTLYTVVAFLLVFAVIFIILWACWLRRNDKTNGSERKEENKDMLIAFVVTFFVSVVIFMAFGGMLYGFVDWLRILIGL